MTSTMRIHTTLLLKMLIMPHQRGGNYSAQSLTSWKIAKIAVFNQELALSLNETKKKNQPNYHESNHRRPIRQMTIGWKCT
mmetsp:Transcript_15523/g.32857  ORF Transcript_15523/g.32857 Transcript_15523/m.32857 type:complete len:81 (-) Transcript_15523:562-804(-)